MLAVLGHIDAVHGSYYLLMHLVVKAGTSEAILRMPSVLAMAVAAWLTAVIGGELAGPRTGLAGGLLFAMSPLTTEYAQDARPFALVTCLAVLASYRFVIFIRTGRTKDAAWYGVALAACGLMNVFGLLLLAGHAATLALSPVRKDRLLRFAWAAAAAALVVSPVALLAASEVAQVSWERKPGPATVAGILAALAVAAIAALAAIRSAHEQQAAHGISQVDTLRVGTAPLVILSAPWLIIPVTILVIGSQIPIPSAPGAAASAAAGSGIWQPRYLLFCFPALVLLLVALTARLRPKAATILTVALIAGAAAAQPFTRPATSPDNLRAVSALLQARARSGDAVIFPNIAKRLIKAAYPAGFAHVRDVGLDRSATARDSLYGLNVSSHVLWHRLAGTERVWMIIFPVPRPVKYFGNPTAPRAFCLERSWQFSLNMVLLYHRCLKAERPI